VSSEASIEQVRESILSTDLNNWIDYCSNTTGWVAQNSNTDFNSPIRVVEEGDLAVDFGALCFANLQVPDRNNTGPLYVKDLGMSLPLYTIRFFWVEMEYQYTQFGYGGLTILLFDNDKKVVASFNLIDRWSENPIAMSICYYLPRTTIPLAEHYYETTSTNPNPEFTLFYVEGSEHLACVTFLDTRQSVELVEHGDYNASREIRYIGIQGICDPFAYDYGVYYKLDEIQIMYLDEPESTSTTNWETIDYTTTYETPNDSTTTDGDDPHEPTGSNVPIRLITIAARSISIASLFVIAIIVLKTIQLRASMEFNT
jgi:hypothetical protein